MKHTVPFLFIISALIIITACKNNPAPNTIKADASKDSVTVPQSFFPVVDYIGGQLKLLDSFQPALSATVKVNNITTLHAATNPELHTWAANFLQPDISSPALKTRYTETNIADQSAPSVTLIYTAKDDTLAVQKINVFIKPSSTESDKVTGVYIEKIFTLRDTVFNQKLYWKTGKNMQVVTEKKVNGITLPLEQIKITWDPSE